MPMNYLKKSTHIIWITLLVLSFLFVGLLFLLPILAAYFALIFLARKKMVRLHDHVAPREGLIFSPVTGQIKSIRSRVSHPVFGAELMEIELALPWWRPWGLYLPAGVEMIDRAHNKLSRFFLAKKLFTPAVQMLDQEGHLLSFIRPDGRRIGLQLLPSFWRGDAQVSVMPGDRGVAAAPFGHLPFGGTVLLYLTENCEILVQINEFVEAGETALAGEV